MTLRKRVLAELGNPTLGANRVPRKNTIEGKTDRMRVIEVQNGGVDIKDLLKEGTVREASIRLGINFGTVSLWRRALGLSDGKGMSGHQMHKESCGPKCHAVSLGRCYAPSCEHPTCECWHYDGDDSTLCKECNARMDHERCMCLQ